ncbi:TonB-dependent receptor [Draconibacterium sp. IB214405]|uniref:TonB-dependent receptor n=1 Tax=Draconibacterium sp. IB214405 TaxID=3097352 RepID=UPI002A1565F5|nr:TonB-dependent receptor [Draconibacterium sp. IB214405]MDX8338621.1 TonB-dependent receptor [Draconibacterium sp. IB214405]
MKKFNLTLFITLFSIYCVLGQSYVRVVNAKTGTAVEHAMLISENFFTQTDEEGKAKLDGFKPDEKILFKHSSYISYVSTRQKIENQSRTVLLVESPVRLDEVVISVNRWKQSKTEIPHTIKSIQPEEVMHYNPQTTADMLGTESGVFIQKSQMGGGSPMIRGFAANRVLIMVDGIRMNNAIYRNGNLQNVISVDAQSLQNTEIIFGPGSVIYGSDALGGVMSFNTLSPKLSTSDNFENAGKVYTRYSSANFEKTGHFSYNLGGKKWASVFSATFTDFDDLKMGSSGPDEYLRPQYVLDAAFTGEDQIIENKNDREQKYTGYHQFNVLGKLRFRPNETIDMELSAQHSETGDIPRYDRLIEYSGDKLKYAQWYYGPQDWTLLSGRLQFQKDMLLFDKANLLLGYQDYTESRHDRKRNKDVLRHRTENVNVYSANLDFGKIIDTKSELFYGLEGYFNKVGSTGYSENLITGEQEDVAPRYPNDSKYSSLAAYYSFKYSISPKIIFQMGSRFTYTHLEGEFDTNYYQFPFDGFNMNNSAFNGNLGIVWHPTTDWQINIHGSTGFRSPNIDDVAKVFDSEPGTVIVPNPDLKPEYARNLELSIIRSYENKVKVEVTGFYTWLKDAMVRRAFDGLGQDSILYDGEMSRVEALVNAESATIYGTTANIEYLFNNQWRTRHDITITKGEDSDGLPIRHVPPTFGSSHIIFEGPKLYLDLYVNYSGKLDFDELAPDEQDKPHLYLPDENGNPYSPSWWTANIKSNYRINSHLTLSGGIENIFSKRYRPYSSGVVSAGRNFVISALLKI